MWQSNEENGLGQRGKFKLTVQLENDYDCNGSDICAGAVVMEMLRDT